MADCVEQGEEEEQAKRLPNVKTIVKKEEDCLMIDHTEGERR